MEVNLDTAPAILEEMDISQFDHKALTLIGLVLSIILHYGKNSPNLKSVQHNHLMTSLEQFINRCAQTAMSQIKKN